jgi:hypothetical protein
MIKLQAAFLVPRRTIFLFHETTPNYQRTHEKKVVHVRNETGRIRTPEKQAVSK